MPGKMHRQHKQTGQFGASLLVGHFARRVLPRRKQSRPARRHAPSLARNRLMLPCCVAVAAVLSPNGWYRLTLEPENEASGGLPEDLVGRDFGADAPDRLWLADLTWVRTRSGSSVRGVG